MTDRRIEFRPFSNGTEYEMFMDQNCFKCKKYDFDEETYTTTCPIIEAVEDSGAGIEPLSFEMAARMGYLGEGGREINPGQVAECTEFVKGKPEPKVPPPPLPVDQQLRNMGAVTLPGFER